MVKVDDEAVLCGLDVLWPKELSRARTPKGVERRDDDERPRRSAARLATVCGRARGISGEPFGGNELSAPWRSCSPLSSSWNLACTR